MNIQDRERDALKKNLPPAFGKIHLLKNLCQDNRVKHFLIYVKHLYDSNQKTVLKTYFVLSHPLARFGQWPVTFLVSEYQPNVAGFGFPAHKEEV